MERANSGSVIQMTHVILYYHRWHLQRFKMTIRLQRLGAWYSFYEILL